jgi:mannitol 2-dehydrogenase
VIDANDPVWPRLNALALRAKNDPLQWLTMDDIYGDVAKDETFRAAFSGWLNMLWHDGVAKTLQHYISNG